MSTYSTDRRSLLRIIGSVGATCAFPFASEDLYGQTQAHAHHIAATVAPHFFNERDFKTIARIADLIIPPTDTAGAGNAGVPEYIDALVARNTDHQLVFADGLRWLDGESQRAAQKWFLELTEEQQLAILEPVCATYDADPENRARNIQFFGLMKNLTADGYYTSRVGLMDELQYQGNKILSSYPECR
jgi:gluconate 2-dehydrogenase gamma chain